MSADRPIRFTLEPGDYCIGKLPRDAEIPDPTSSGFWSVTRTPDELSMICFASQAPENVDLVRGWRCLKLIGPPSFTLKGVLQSFLTPLAQADICVLTVSTYDTDYVFVTETDLEKAIQSLIEAGYEFTTPGQ